MVCHKAILNGEDVLASMYDQLHVGFSLVCMPVSIDVVHVHWTANYYPAAPSQDFIPISMHKKGDQICCQLTTHMPLQMTSICMH